MSPVFRPEHPDIAPEMWPQIDDIITANRSIKGSVITVLRKCQDVVGYLPVELMEYIARGMNLARSFCQPQMIQEVRAENARNKFLSSVCADNPYADVWQPASGTCEDFREAN